MATPYSNQGPYPPYPKQQDFPQQAVYPPQQAGFYAGGAAPYTSPPPYPPPQGFFVGGQQGYPGQQYPEPYFAPPSADPSGMATYGGVGDSIGGDGIAEFSDKAIRRGFIRKVYGILMCQLLVTLGGICFFMYHAPARRFVAEHPWTYIVGLVFTIIIILILSCCGEVRRKSPWNFILLATFTVIESFMLGTIASYYQTEEVVMAVGITAAVCLGITLFAFQTKWDFTGIGSYLFVFLLVLVIFGFVAIFVRSKTVSLVYSCLAVLLFSFYLIYDTQLLLGGKHKYSISPEEYIFAALNLYLDIIQIFMHILSIIGSSHD